MDELESYVLRQSDFGLSKEQGLLQDTFHTFFDRKSPASVVRDAEPLGWSRDLWSDFTQLHGVEMAIPVEAGGNGAGLVELALVAEEVGRSAAPIPYVESVVAGRLLATAPRSLAEGLIERLLTGEIATFVLDGGEPGRRSLVPAGAVASLVLYADRSEVQVVENLPTFDAEPNLACAPVSWGSRPDASSLVSRWPAGRATLQAEVEWLVLWAATCVGLADRLNSLSVAYASDRIAFGVPIGTFQAVSHPLVDVAIGIEGARRLVHKAAWFSDKDPESIGALPWLAFAQAAEVAERAGVVAVHTHGGIGLSSECDVQLYFRRAKGWAMLIGEPGRILQRAADMLLLDR